MHRKLAQANCETAEYYIIHETNWMN